MSRAKNIADQVVAILKPEDGLDVGVNDFDEAKAVRGELALLGIKAVAKTGMESTPNGWRMRAYVSIPKARKRKQVAT